MPEILAAKLNDYIVIRRHVTFQRHILTRTPALELVKKHMSMPPSALQRVRLMIIRAAYALLTASHIFKCLQIEKAKDALLDNFSDSPTVCRA